jgi:AraC-like DNA-binding protein
VNAKSVRGVLFAAGALGLDAPRLAHAWGLERALTDVDARFAYGAWLSLWRDIAQRSGSESVGIEAAKRLPWGHWDVIDYLIGTSENLGTALTRFERYFALISTAVTHTLERDGERVQLVRRYPADTFTSLLAPAEFSFASVVIRLRIALGAPNWVPLAVHFASPGPKDDSAQRQLFGCPVRFDAPIGAIVMEASALDLRLKEPDPELSRILEKHAEQLIGQLDTSSDLVSRTRWAIVNGLRDNEISVAGAARALGMSARTLQRRLQERGVSFDEVFDDTRKSLALRYLRDPALSIQEASHLLGFGDLRGFYRAFRRWEGCTPATFRKRVGAARP